MEAKSGNYLRRLALDGGLEIGQFANLAKSKRLELVHFDRGVILGIVSWRSCFLGPASVEFSPSLAGEEFLLQVVRHPFRMTQLGTSPSFPTLGSATLHPNRELELVYQNDFLQALLLKWTKVGIQPSAILSKSFSRISWPFIL